MTWFTKTPLSKPHQQRTFVVALAWAFLALAMPTAQGADGKLVLTGGVSSIDGAAGGGLTPWALIASHASAGQWGATAFATRAVTRDYALTAKGVAAAWDDRFELSLAHQDFNAAGTGAALGVPGLHLKQLIVGAKLRVAGEAVLDSDTWMPQLALGVQRKRVDAGGLAPTLAALGARTTGHDVYVSATKLWLAQGLLNNVTLRATRANQNGLLGFGGTHHQGWRLQPEISLAWLLARNLAIGAEVRFKPDNLNPSILADGLREDNWRDVFIAWAPSKNLSFTLAWVDLGRIVPAVAATRQTGAYLSMQLSH